MNAPFQLHPVLKQLSHSSILLLHACPRKYELTKLLGRQDAQEDSEDLTFGDAVGYGIQQLLLGRKRDVVWFEIFMRWKRDIFNTTDGEERKKKTLWHAFNALEVFERRHLPSILEKYEVAEFDGKPACELGFRINIGSGYSYRGYVDTVLIDRATRELVVLEIKTTASKFVGAAKFQNSGQALGYSIVCDFIAQHNKTVEGSSYKVNYLVYLSTEMAYQPLPFNKSHAQRALWIKNLISEIEALQLYEREQHFPMHGESCESWNRPCDFLNVCNISNEFTTKGANPKVEEKEYTFEIPLMDLINSQLVRHEQEITT